jgi:hypothetical protein
MGINLTTRLKVKTFMSLDTTKQDDDIYLDMLIGSVSAQIAETADRIFERRKYKMWLDGSGTSRMRLPQYPIRRLILVSLNTRNVGEITYTGTGKHASANIEQKSQRISSSTENPTVELMHITAAGAETFNSVATDGKTVTELSSCVGAISGWTMTVESGWGDYSAALIRPRLEWTVSTDDLDVDIADEAASARIVPEGEDLIELLYSCFPAGRSNVFAWWDAGYTLPTEGGEETGNGEVPQGLELVANSAVRDLFKARKKDTTRKSFKLADYAETLDTNSVRATVQTYQKELWPYIRKSAG